MVDGHLFRQLELKKYGYTGGFKVTKLPGADSFVMKHVVKLLNYIGREVVEFTRYDHFPVNIILFFFIDMLMRGWDRMQLLDKSDDEFIISVSLVVIGEVILVI